MEIAFKFQIPAGRLRAVDEDMRSKPATRTHLQAHYFDSVDRALAAQGVVLRVCQEGTRWVQTIRAPGDGPWHRLQHEVEIEIEDAGEGTPMPDVRRHRGGPLWKRLRRSFPKGFPHLLETCSTDLWRLARTHTQGATTVSLTLDHGRVHAPAHGGHPGGAVPVCELTLERVDGRWDELASLARQWRHRHGLWISTLSEAQRGERLAAVKAGPPQFSRGHAGRADGGDGGDLPGEALQRAVLAACLGQILPNASALASGHEDPEIVHQLRVGLRRLRTALRELDGLAPGRFDPRWMPPLTETFRSLGVRRDHDILLSSVRQRLKDAGAPALREFGNEAPGPPPQEVVRDARFQDVLIALLAFTAPCPTGAGPKRGQAPRSRSGGEVAPIHLITRRLRKLHRQVVRDGERFESLSATAQHRVRKRLKRLRYLAEFAEPLFAGKAASRYIARLVPAQDALGDFNDDVVALSAYATATADEPHAWFAVGWLKAQVDDKAHRCHAALAHLRKARRFWKKGR